MNGNNPEVAGCSPEADLEMMRKLDIGIDKKETRKFMNSHPGQGKILHLVANQGRGQTKEAGDLLPIPSARTWRRNNIVVGIILSRYGHEYKCAVVYTIIKELAINATKAMSSTCFWRAGI
jgi:hypothetical protein